MSNTEAFLDFFEHRIKEDKEAAFFTFHTGLSKNSDDPRNIFMKGESSIGKTWVTTNVLSLFNDKDVWYLGGLSPTAFYHDFGTLVNEHGDEIDLSERPSKDKVKWELQQEDPTKKVSKKEVLKEYYRLQNLWNEKMKHSYYRVDLRGKVLVFLDAPHPETFAKLLPILSHDKEQISYKFTDKTGKGRLRTTHVKINGWPATIFCTTNREWLQDFSTRSFTITPRTTEKKLRAALEMSGNDYAFPKRFREKHPGKLKLLLECLEVDLQEERFEVLIPYSRELAQVVGLYGPRVMRDFKHICTFIKLNAALNWTARPQIKDGNELFVLASAEDVKTVLEMFKFCEETTVTGLGQTIIDIFHRVMKPLGTFDYETLVDEVNKTFSFTLSSKTLYKYVRELSKIGWVNQQPHPEDKRKKLVRVIRKEENLLSSSLYKFQAFFTLHSFKAWLKQFIELFSQNEEVSIPDFQLDEIPRVKWDNEVEDVFNEHYTLDVQPPKKMGNMTFPFSETKSKTLEQSLNGQRRLVQSGNSSREEKRTIPEETGIDQAFQTSCPLCHQPIHDTDSTTFHESKRVHVGCLRKLKEGRKNV